MANRLGEAKSVTKARSRLQKLDALASVALRSGVFCIWPVAVAIALGATLFAVTHADRLAAMFDNRLTQSERFVSLGYFGVSLVVVASIYLVVLLYRRREKGPPSLAQAKRLNRYLSFLLSGPFLVALTEPKIETHHQWRTWLYIALAVLAWWPTFRALGARSRIAHPRPPVLSSRQRDILGLGFALALWAAYSYVFSKLSIANHHAFNTRLIDLGLYDNIFFHSSHGDPLGCSFLRGGSHTSAHFDPILAILSPLYRLWPRAEFLLTLQAVWCGAGAVAAYLVGREQLSSRAWGLVWALAYVLHPALHGANLYEFHSLTLLFSPLLFALYFLLSGKIRLYFVALGLLLLIREDVSLLMCFVGLYGVISEDLRLRRAGWITIVISLAYFVVAKTVFMSSIGLFNQGDESYGFAYYYAEMIPNKLGELDFITTLLTNPAFLVALVTKGVKIHYLLVIFFPLLFLPAWAGRARAMLLYGLVFTLLASKMAVYSSHFQYSAVFLPVAIALAPLGLRRLQKGRPRGFTAAAMGCVLVASVLVSWKHGAIPGNSSFRGGFRTVTYTLNEARQERYDAFLALISHIEPDASVSSTDRVGSHVSNRLEAYRLDQDIDSDYVLVDSHDLRGRAQVILKKRENDGKIELVGREDPWRLYRAVTPPETD